MTADPQPNARDRISDIDAALLRKGYFFSGPMSVVNPTDLGMSVLTSLDLFTGLLRVSGDPTLAGNQIDVAQDGNTVFVTINGRQTQYPAASVRSIAVVAPGDDHVTLATTFSGTVAGQGRGTLSVAVPPTGTVNVGDQAIWRSDNGAILSAISYGGFARVEAVGAIGQGTVVVASTSASTPLFISNVNRVALGASLDGILGPVDISGIVSELTIDDSASTTARNAALFRTAVTNLAPAPITFGGADVTTFRLLTPVSASSLIVADTPQNSRGELLSQVTMGNSGDGVLVQRTTGSLLLDLGGGANTVSADFPRLQGSVFVYGAAGSTGLYANAGVPGVLATMGTYPGFGLGYVLAAGHAPLFYSIPALSSLTVQLAAPPAGSLGALLSVDDTAVGGPGFATFVRLGGAADFVDVNKSSGLLAIVGQGEPGTQVRIGGQQAKTLAGFHGQFTVVNAGIDVLDQNAPAAEAVNFGPDRLLVNGAPAFYFSGATRLRYGGSNRANTYNIDATPGGDLSVNGGTAADTFRIAPTSRRLLGIGQVVVNGGGGGDTLLVDDSNSIGGAAYGVTVGRVIGLPVTAILRGPTVVYGFAITSAALNGSSVASTYAVTALQGGIPTTVRAGAGDDQFLIQKVDADGPVALDGGAGLNTLDYSAATLPPPPPPVADGGGGGGGGDGGGGGGGVGGGTIPSGLVAWFRAENGATDSTGKHDGTASNVTYGPGEVNRAFQFDGTGAVTIPDAPDLNNPNFTFETWVNPTPELAAGQSRYIASKGGNNAIGLYTQTFSFGDTELFFFVRSSDAASDTAFVSVLFPRPNAAAPWHHVAATFDGATLRLYLDGALVRTAASRGPVYYTGSPDRAFRIGNTTGTADSGFIGSIDEPSLYDRALTAAEVQAIFSAGAVGKVAGPSAPAPVPPGLVAWYRAEGSGADSTRNHDGTPISLTYGPGEVGQAFQFGGTGSVFAPDAPDLDAQNLTVETWVKPQPMSENQTHYIVSKGTNNYAIGLFQDTLYFQVTVGPNNLALQASVHVDPDTWIGQWHHVAGTFDGKLLRLYLDGQFVAGRESEAPIHYGGPSDQNLRIGVGAEGVGSNFSGSIDELSLYNRVLTAAEIQSIVAAGTLGKATAPPPPPPLPPGRAPGVEVNLKTGRATGFLGGIAGMRKVIGSATDDILVGDGGATLDGGGGRDLLIAGRSAGTLTSRGDSILIGGTTAYDADLAALDAVLAAWTKAGASYQDRVSTLVNGLLAPGRVTKNGQRNTLGGGAGKNLFFHSALDVTDRRDDEAEVLL